MVEAVVDDVDDVDAVDAVDDVDAVVANDVDVAADGLAVIVVA